MSSYSNALEKIGFKKLHSDAKLPTKNEGDIGWDFYCVKDDYFKDGYKIPEEEMSFHVSATKKLFALYPGERYIFSTGLAPILPKKLNLLLWDRSGLSVNKGIHRLAGVIDSSYTGEIKVCLYNSSDYTYIVAEGDKIVQGILQWEVPAEVEWVKELGETERGNKGFGSTGK